MNEYDVSVNYFEQAGLVLKDTSKAELGNTYVGKLGLVRYLNYPRFSHARYVTLAVRGDYEPAAFCAWTVYTESYQKYGEVAMVLVDPHYRGNGFGTMLSRLGTLRSLGQNPDELYSTVADETGRIHRLRKALGFSHIRWDGDYRVMTRAIVNQADREALASRLKSEIIRPLVSRSGNWSKLSDREAEYLSRSYFPH